MAIITVNPADSLRVSIFCRIQNQVAVNVRGYQLDAFAPVDVDGETVADAFYSHFSASYIAVMSSLADFYGVSVMFAANTVNPQVANSTIPPSDGLVDEDPLPTQTCGLISLTTGFTGRSNRGRIYLPFPAESNNNASGLPDDPYVTGLLAIRDKLIETVTAGPSSFVPVLLNAQNLPNRRITGGRVRNRWATQRRRGAFGSPNNVPF